MNKPIPYGRQNITPEDIEAVVETLRSDYLTQGPRIPEFERKFADYVGAPYAVAVNNATSGLHIAAKALDVKPGDRVIVTPMTFAASANCIRYCGGDVTFCDIDPKTYLMDEQKLLKILEENPAGTFAGMVIVDFAGYPHNLERFREIADRFGPGGVVHRLDGHSPAHRKCPSCRLHGFLVPSRQTYRHRRRGDGHYCQPRSL